MKGFSLGSVLAESRDEVKKTDKLRCAGNTKEAIEMSTQRSEPAKAERKDSGKRLQEKIDGWK